jgi:hypothetical protein
VLDEKYGIAKIRESTWTPLLLDTGCTPSIPRSSRQNSPSG